MENDDEHPMYAGPSPGSGQSATITGCTVMTVVGALLSLALTVLTVLIIARVVCDWIALFTRVRDGWFGRVQAAIHAVTEPVLVPARRLLPAPRIGQARLDLSPLGVLVAAALLQPIAGSL